MPTEALAHNNARLTSGELAQLRSAGFESADEARRILQATAMSLEEFARRRPLPEPPGARVRVVRPVVHTRGGWSEIIESALGAGAARRYAFLSDRLAELEPKLERAHEALDPSADALEMQLAEVNDELERMYQRVHEEGGEQERELASDVPPIEAYIIAALTDPWRGAGDDRTDAQIVAYNLHEAGIDTSELSEADLEAIGHELVERHQRTITSLKAARARRGVPEHVRVAHELAKLRAGRIPAHLQRKLLPGLVANSGAHHAALLIVGRTAARGGTAGQAMLALLRAGYDVKTAAVATGLCRGVL